MKKSFIAVPPFAITTIVYALLTTIFFKLDKVFGEAGNFVVNDIDNTYPQELDTPCKSPCPSTAEMCIQICN